MRNKDGMSETKNPGEKKLSVSGGKLTLKPRTETGVVRQSFSHGRSKQVVVEVKKRRVVGGDGKRKLNAALQRNMGEKPREIAIIETLAGGQLDLALHRPNVVHAALLAGPGSETFLVRVARLARFRTGISTDEVSAMAPTDGARGQYTE